MGKFGITTRNSAGSAHYASTLFGLAGIPLILLSNVNYHYDARHELQIRRFEMEHHVPVRWTPDMEAYKEAKRVEPGEEQKVKEKMLHAVRERTFYINTPVHHAGNMTCICRLILCSKGGQKQAQKVSKLIITSRPWKMGKGRLDARSG